MKFYRSRVIISVILLFLMSRVVIDVVWSGPKPIFIVAYYTLFSLIFSLYFIKKGKAGRILIPFVLFFFPITLLASQINSASPLFEHIQFALQVFIPCLFLVSATNVPKLMNQISLVYKHYLLFWVIFLLMIASYASYMQNAQAGESYYQYYVNTPNHVIAQTLLKASLPFITGGLFWVAIPFALVFTLNVRSVILGYILSFAATHRHILLKIKTVKKLVIFGLPLLIVVLTNLNWTEVYERVVFKERDINNLGIIEAITSGRLGIYQFYLSYISENFGTQEWLFGSGPIWLQAGGPTLSAHNDLLNLLVSFGMFGLVSTLACYFYFLAKLPHSARPIFIAAFGVLFLTNGVVFHQSNILFVLLYFFLDDGSEAPQKTSAPLYVRTLR